MGLSMASTPDVRRLRIAVAATAAEFLLAQFVVDSAVLRGVTGFALGASAAPFILQGVEEVFSKVMHDSL